LATQSHVRIGTVGLLALLAWPLAAGFLLYHIYLIWAGTTTNESGKWADLREDITDGFAWRAERERIMGPDAECCVLGGVKVGDAWPTRGRWIVIRVFDDRGWRGAGRGEDDSATIWDRVESLADVENVYDLGFWENLKDAFSLRGQVFYQ